ncbi:conserved hypothetical protein [Ricinus communis]|uniref:Pre-rRNA-processing protein RIX1 N-terminal domain-containing protein n=1 Tax=Ricinus communis TaxID=3988 RepID=B9S5A1_RICCO|nr:conserved hypothetical protein [Ricinus communis]|eukprot:XP_002521170.1 proline-, glutamic acid- and leucine-rich protein 1 [Ricinus communis]
MAALENSKDMYDVALKPRMLLTMLKEDVPDDNNKKPIGNASKLSRIVSTVQTFNLLSESFTASMETKLIERWKSAVDDWQNRVVSLVVNSSSMPDKCWAGICLLGVTCQECSSHRFLASYAVWFDKLLLHIQSPVDSQFVKVASCTSLSDLLVRLAGFPNAKKDGTWHAGKLIQPILKLLQDDSSETVWEGAIHLLCTLISCFPASVPRHYDSVEAVIASKILSGKCSVTVLKKLAYCLAILPKSRGDEDSWLAMMRKILLLVNGYLTEIFHGLEEETKWDEAVRLLVPPGEATPIAIWSQNLLEETSDKARKRSKLSSVSTLMLSCCTMLTTSYPVQVTVPVRSLLAIIERVLMVDGSVPRASSNFVIATEQEFICSELPVLHSSILDLLTSVIKGMRSQLLPHAAYIVRLVKEYFRRCQLSELRIKTYSITKVLLTSMGVGIAIYLAQEVVNNSLLDLDPSVGCIFSSAYSKASFGALLQPCNRKRKHGASEQNYDQLSLEMEAPKSCPASTISVKIAALEALRTLLTVGGALKSESWRSKVEKLLITLAADSCKGGWSSEERTAFLPNGVASTYADLQLAVLRALLASLLSPSRVRPPHLAQSLELFHRGKQETGTEISEFCSYALSALEVLIHPRALPLADLPSANSSHEINYGFPETLYSGGQKHNTPISSGMRGIGHGSPDSDDDLCDSWLDGNKETDTPDKITISNKPSENLKVQQAEKNFLAGPSATKSPRQSELEPAADSADVETGNLGDEMIVRTEEVKESNMQLQGLSFSKGKNISRVTDGTGFLVSQDNETTPADIGMADEGGETAAVPPGGNAYTSSSTLKGAAASAFESDDDSSTDTLPDIVDADPDSD